MKMWNNLHTKKKKALTINKGIPKAIRHRRELNFCTITTNNPQMKLIAKFYLNSIKIIFLDLIKQNKCKTYT